MGKIEICQNGDTNIYEAVISLNTKNRETAEKKINILKFKIAQMSKRRPKRRRP